MSNTQQRHEKAFKYAMNDKNVSSGTIRRIKRSSKRKVLDHAKEFKSLQKKEGAQTDRKYIIIL